MYDLFIRHHILPGDYFRLPAGDKVVIRAFFERYMEDMQERPKPKRRAK